MVQFGHRMSEQQIGTNSEPGWLWISNLTHGAQQPAAITTKIDRLTNSSERSANYTEHIVTSNELKVDGDG
jgi:hypothetical protein